MNPLETYLIELREIHDSGAATRETSGYPVPAKLLESFHLAETETVAKAGAAPLLHP
jgi:hypothetical protein